MLQHIELSKKMLNPRHFLNISIGLEAVNANTLAVAWATRLQEDRPALFPLAAPVNRLGIPTMAADICFHSEATITSIFSLSLNNDSDQPAVPAVNLVNSVDDAKMMNEITLSLLLDALNQKTEAAYAHVLEQVNKLAQGRTLVESSKTTAGILQLDEGCLLAIAVKQVGLNDGQDKLQALEKTLKRGVASIWAAGAQPIGFAYHLISRDKTPYETLLHSQSLPLLAHAAEMGATESLAILAVGQLEKPDVITSILNRAETTLILVDIKPDRLPKHFILSVNAIDQHLLMTLAHVCIKSQLGVNLKVDADTLLSSNYVGHLLLEIPNDKLKETREIFASQQITYHQLGRTTRALVMQFNNDIQLPLQVVKDNWQHILSDMI